MDLSFYYNGPRVVRLREAKRKENWLSRHFSHPLPHCNTPFCSHAKKAGIVCNVASRKEIVPWFIQFLWGHYLVSSPYTGWLSSWIVTIPHIVGSIYVIPRIINHLGCEALLKSCACCLAVSLFPSTYIVTLRCARHTFGVAVCSRGENVTTTQGFRDQRNKYMPLQHTYMYISCTYTCNIYIYMCSSSIHIYI